jgi:hypothetical protein
VERPLSTSIVYLKDITNIYIRESIGFREDVLICGVYSQLPAEANKKQTNVKVRITVKD